MVIHVWSHLFNSMFAVQFNHVHKRWKSAPLRIDTIRQINQQILKTYDFFKFFLPVWKIWSIFHILFDSIQLGSGCLGADLFRQKKPSKYVLPLNRSCQTCDFTLYNNVFTKNIILMTSLPFPLIHQNRN